MPHPELTPESPSPPGFEFDFNITAERRDALENFSRFAGSLSPEDIDAVLLPAMEIYDSYPSATGRVIDFLWGTPQDRLEALGAWRRIQETGAARATSFEEQTEAAIDNDPKHQELLDKVKNKSTATTKVNAEAETEKESSRAELIRNRFRIFAVRAALAAAPNQTHNAA